MTEPAAFTITVAHDPHGDTYPWTATIRREPRSERWGEFPEHVALSETRARVIAEAQAWIRAETAPREPAETLRATADGELIAS